MCYICDPFKKTEIIKAVSWRKKKKNRQQPLNRGKELKFFESASEQELRFVLRDTVWRDTLKNRRTYQRLGEDFTVLPVTSWECRSIADCAKHVVPGWTMKTEAESD